VGDPLNLIQVMLAKGGVATRFLTTFPDRSSLPRCLCSQSANPERPNAMIADPQSSFEPHSSEQLPASNKVYVPGSLHPNLRVPMREIEVSPTKSYTGAVTPNDPVRVYDCSGPWGDPAFAGTSEQGLPPLRRDWILQRGDVEEIAGREVKPQDNGYLSGKHAEYASKAEKNRLVEFPCIC
jgi:phosphomethylpyrimidine synthase